MHIQVQDLPSTFSHWLTYFDAAECCFSFLWLLLNFKVQHESVSALTLRSISTIQAMHGCENVFGTRLLSAIHANITGMSNALNKNSKHYNMKRCLTPSSNHSWSHFSAATKFFSWTFKGTFGKWKMIEEILGINSIWETNESKLMKLDMGQVILISLLLIYPLNNRQFSWDILT